MNKNELPDVDERWRMLEQTKWLHRFTKTLLLRYYYAVIERSIVSSSDLMDRETTVRLENWFCQLLQIPRPKGGELSLYYIAKNYKLINVWAEILQDIEKYALREEWAGMQQKIDSLPDSLKYVRPVGLAKMRQDYAARGWGLKNWRETLAKRKENSDE